MWLSLVLLSLCISLSIQAGGSRPLLGGWNDASELEEGVQKMIPHAVNSVSRQINSNRHYRMTKLLSAKKKVVAGMLYQLKIELQGTKCRKNDVHVIDVNDCEFDESLPIEVCSVEVWSQPWVSPEPKIQKVACNTLEKKEVHNE